jgi:putative redox protein
MVAQSFRYLGELHCEAVHAPSGVRLITDAPTDLLVTALATCKVTTIAIAVEQEGVRLAGTKVYAEKHMSTDPPRRIAKIVVKIDFPAGIATSHRTRLENIARACPVAKSIHPDIKLDVTFTYPD